MQRNRNKVYVYVISFIIFLLCAPAIHAIDSGEACLSTDYCNIGDVCLLNPATNSKTCVVGPDDCTVVECGNGYTCDPINNNCREDHSAGVPIGNIFQNNFSSSQTNTLLGPFVSRSLGQSYIISLALVLIYLIGGIYKYMLSGGDPIKITDARKQILWAIVGEIIIFLSYGAFKLVSSLLNNVY